MSVKQRFAEIESEYRRPQKVLTVDIETSPNIVFAWGLWNQNISLSQLIEPSRVLSVAAKWLHKKNVMFFSEHHDGHDVMVRKVWDLYDEADIVVTYNGVRFDNPHLMREFLLAGLGKPSPWQDVDLLNVAKSQFKFASNKLAFVTEAVGLPTKLETGGQQLWNRVLDGDEKAWALFKRYNMQDVRITEQLYVLLRPWFKGQHMGQWTGNMSSCYQCGGTDLSLVGLLRYKAMAYPKTVCGSCGAVNKVLRNGETRAA